MTADGVTEITSQQQLRELLGVPAPRAVTKERTRLHARDREWLAASPFCLIATSAADGSCDVSPKGDPPGFTLVLDDTTIVIPDRPGNRRADGFGNVLSNPHVGLISIVPGRNDTLRINGQARLVRDAPFFEQMEVRGKRPILALVIDVEQVFYHCAKAFMRASLWQPDTWQPDALMSVACRTKLVQDTPETLAELEDYYRDENYRKKLY